VEEVDPELLGGVDARFGAAAPARLPIEVAVHPLHHLVRVREGQAEELAHDADGDEAA
jgi:hypothetical protein